MKALATLQAGLVLAGSLAVLTTTVAAAQTYGGALSIDGGDGSPIAAVDTTEAADEFFITQWGPTPYNSGATPYGYNDCGPASVLMSLVSLGLHERPSPLDASGVLDAVRDQALGRESDYSERMGFDELARALRAYGARSEWLPGRPLEAVDSALERGNPLIVGGNPWKAWGKAERAAGNYLNSRDPGNHFIAVLGRTADGLYIVGDPLVRNGTLAVASEQLRDFFASWFGTLEVSRRAPAGLLSLAGSAGESTRK